MMRQNSISNYELLLGSTRNQNKKIPNTLMSSNRPRTSHGIHYPTQNILEIPQDQTIQEQKSILMKPNHNNMSFNSDDVDRTAANTTRWVRVKFENKTRFFALPKLICSSNSSELNSTLSTSTCNSATSNVPDVVDNFTSLLKATFRIGDPFTQIIGLALPLNDEDNVRDGLHDITNRMRKASLKAQTSGQNTCHNLPKAIFPIQMVANGQHPLELLPRSSNRSVNDLDVEFELVVSMQPHKPLTSLNHYPILPLPLPSIDTDSETRDDTGDEEDEHSIVYSTTTEYSTATHTTASSSLASSSTGGADPLLLNATSYVILIQRLVKSQRLNYFHGIAICEALTTSSTYEHKQKPELMSRRQVYLVILKALVVSKWNQDEDYFIQIMTSLGIFLLEEKNSSDKEINLKMEPMGFSDMEDMFDIAELLIEENEIDTHQYISLLQLILDRDLQIQNIHMNHEYKKLVLHENTNSATEEEGEAGRDLTTTLNNYDATEYLIAALNQIATMSSSSDESDYLYSRIRDNGRELSLTTRPSSAPPSSTFNSNNDTGFLSVVIEAAHNLVDNGRISQENAIALIASFSFEENQPILNKMEKYYLEFNDEDVLFNLVSTYVV